MTCNQSQLTADEIILYRFRGYFTPSIASFGIMGNLFVIIAFTKMQLRQPSRFNLYVICISFMQTVDLIVNGLLDDFMGRGLTWVSDCSIFIKLDTYSSFSCKFFSYVPKTTAFSSNALLVVFSFDRFLTAFQPIRFRGDRHIRLVVCCIAFTVLFGSVLFLPQITHNGLLVSRRSSLIGRTTCGYIDSTKHAVQYVLYLSIIGTYILPTFIITIMNILILIKLRVLTRNRYRLGVDRRQSSNEMHRITGHLILTTMFLFLTFPLVVVIVLRQQSDFAGYKQTRPIYAKRLVNLSKLFSSFDAMVYSSQFPIFLVFLPNFRHMLLRILCGCACIRNSKLGMNCLRYTDSDSQKRRFSSRSGTQVMAQLMQVIALSGQAKQPVSLDSV